MTTWNRPGFLGQAIESVRAQTFRDWGLIIADDGSTDNTKAVVAEWLASSPSRSGQKKDARIKYFNAGHFGRIAKISNAALKQAQSEYVAILDDDDYWLDEHKLEEQIKFLDANRDYVGCGGGFVVVDENGKEKNRFFKPEKDQAIRQKLLLANPMVNSTTVFRRAVAEKLGYYDETILQFADWDFWLKMGRQGKLYNFQRYFTAYRVWKRGTSFTKQRECARSGITIVFRYGKFYPNFSLAVIIAAAFAFYAYIPEFLKRALNPPLSRLKKFLFQR